MTDPLGQSQVLPYLSGLSKQGYTIFLISCEKPEIFKTGKTNIQKICAENNINWYPLPYHHKPPIIGPIYNLWQINKLAKKLVFEHKIQLLHCRSYLSSLIGLGFKKKHGTKFLFDMRGFYANERVDGNIWPQSTYIFKKIYEFFKRKEIEFCQHADYTISLTYNGEKEIHSWKNVNNNPIPIQVIPCCADLDFFSRKNINPTQVDELKKKLNINDNNFVLSYLGAIGTWYLTDEMLQFFKQLKLAKNNAIFLIITAENPEIVYSSAAKQGIDKSSLRVFRATRNEVVQLLSFTNFSIFFIKPAYSKKASSPTKLGELLSMGVPVICNSNVGDVQHIVETSNTGIVIDNFNENAFEDAISKMDNYLNVDITERAKTVNDFFDLKTGVEKYTSVYKKLIG
jgi:glycosyltransferase involved in cell wall biosynthesis